MANPGFPPQMQPHGGPGMPGMGMGPGMPPRASGIPMAGTVRKGTPKIVPVVVSAGLAVGVFCGLYFGLGTGETQEAEANAATAKATGPSGPKSAAGATDESLNFKSADKLPSEVGSGSDATGSATTPPPGTGSATPPPGTGSATTPPGTGSATTPPGPTEVSVALTFTLTPADATITIDGEPVLGGKATITFTGEKKTVRLVAKASGHKTYDKKITVTKDTAEEQIEIKLGKRGSGGTRPPRDKPDERDPPGGLIDL